MTLLSDLQAEGLPVISVSPEFEVTMGDMTTDQHRLYQAVLLHFHFPAEYPDIVQVVKYRLELKNNFNDIMIQLQTYADAVNAPVPELRDQMKYIMTLMIKLMQTIKVVIVTSKD